MIGVFDSGFGGLTILRDIVMRLPEYSYMYLGDTARAPYGDRGAEEVYDLTRQAVDFLFGKGCELIILACNTTSAEALRRIQQEYLPGKYKGKNVLGVIVPTAEVAAHVSQNKIIGVIGTTGTVNASAFDEELHKEDSELKVVKHACPALVPLIEAGKHHTREMRKAIQACIAPIQEAEADTLILGCTHYDVITNDIARAVGDSVKLVSEGPIVAEKIEDYLHRHPEIESKLGQARSVVFYTTGDTAKFEELGTQFYGEAIESSQVTLG